MAISDEITRLQTAKADLKTAIESKGVTVPSTAKLDDYADLVDSITAGGSGDSGSGEMNCVYKEIIAAGTKFSAMAYLNAPIKDNLVVVHAKNTSTSYSYSLQIKQLEENNGNAYWYYQFSIPASGDVLILCDHNTETATLYSKSNQTSTIYYFSGVSGSGGND